MATRSSYATAARALERIIQDRKTEHWRKFASDIGNSNPWGAVYKMCKGKSSTDVCCLRKLDGTFTASWSEAVSVLLDRFLPRGDAAEVLEEANPEVGPPPLITAEEVEEALSRCNPKRAPGLDGKRADIIRQAYAAVPDTMLTLFNKCLIEGSFPDAWKEGRLISWLKSPEKDKKDPGSYRPITLLPVMGKVFERVLVKRLEEQTVISPTQFGFRPGLSTTDL